MIKNIKWKLPPKDSLSDVHRVGNLGKWWFSINKDDTLDFSWQIYFGDYKYEKFSFNDSFHIYEVPCGGFKSFEKAEKSLIKEFSKIIKPLIDPPQAEGEE